MKKKQVVLLTVIAVATLLITVIGATFAWYAANINVEEDNKDDIELSSATLAITYDDGKEVKVSNIVPGWEGKKTIKIEYPSESQSDVDISYSITWDQIENTFKDTEQPNLVYTYSGSCTLSEASCQEPESRAPSSSQETALPSATSSTLLTGTIKKGETHTYVINLKYKNLSSEQDNKDGDEGFAKFNAQFKVEASTATN